MGETKPNKSMETKLKRIAELSREDPQKEFKWLMPDFNEESLLIKVKEWMKKYSHKGTLKELWDIFRINLKGHIQYYGVSFNIHYVQRFVIRAQYIFFKWVNRRGARGKSINWGNLMGGGGTFKSITNNEY